MHSTLWHAPLTTRVINMLHRYGYRDRDAVAAALEERRLAQHQGIGEAALAEIRAWLEREGND
jgi:hypothetical protein